MRHKHADLIIAWANGAQIEGLAHQGVWAIIEHPAWDGTVEYRIKPEPKPDDVLLAWVVYNGTTSIFMANPANESNIKLTFDGETGKLKAAEVLTPEKP